MGVEKGKRPQGVTLLAIYRLFVGVVALFGAGIVGLATLFVLFASGGGAGGFVAFLAFVAIAGIILFFGLASVAVGWGLLEMQSWARWGALVMAVLGLLDFPTGTAVGVLSIWYLTQEGIARAFAGEHDEPASSLVD